MDDEFELVIRDLDSGKSVSAGAALADTGVDPMFLSVFEWLTLSSEVGSGILFAKQSWCNLFFYI